MNISKSIKEFYMQRKNIIINATFLVAFCAAIILFILSNINTATATTSETVTDAEYTLDKDNLELTLSVVQDGVYTIHGAGEQRNNVSIKVVPNNELVTNVTVILEDVLITTSEDKPIISFETAGSESICDYTMKVSGTCRLESTCDGADNALISVQRVNASLIQLKESAVTAENCKLSDLVYDVEMAYGASLTIGEHTTTDNTLVLVTAVGSYGAAIGSGESELEVGVSLNPGNNNVVYEPFYGLDESGNPFPNGEIKSVFDYLNEKYGTNYNNNTIIPAGKEFLVGTTVDSGDITINDNLQIYILGKGYGAGIGGGGSKSIDYPSGRAGIVTINSGTVTICMSLTGAPAIGSGRNSAGGAVNNGNKIVVNGGSLYMNARDDLYDGEMLNAAGDAVFLYVADLSAFGGFGTDWTDTIHLEDEKYDDTYDLEMTVTSTLGSGVISSLTPNYKYDGYGHNLQPFNGSYQYEEDKLYLYLPATPVSELILKNSSFIADGQVITINQDNATITPESGEVKKYITKAGKLVEVKIYDVPSIFEVKEVLVNDKSYPVSLETDSTGTYYMAAFKMPLEPTTVEVIYTGDITIEYDNGFLDTDTNDHGYVEPVRDKYVYGDTLDLEDAYAEDLIFDGWYLEGTNTRIETIRPEDILSGAILSGDVVELTAKWQVEIEYTYQAGSMNETPFGTSDKVAYGEPYSFEADSNSNPIPPTVPQYDFVGWKINGVSYIPGSGNIFSVPSITSKMTVKAEYKRNRFYIYVDKEFFEATDISLVVGSNTIDFETDEYSVDGLTYYRVLITDGSITEASLVINARYGYEISPTNWSVSIINAAASTSLWGDNQVTYTLGIGDADIFVNNNNTTFIPKGYTITLYDGIDMDNPWKVIQYKVDDVTLPLVLAELIGDDIDEMNGRYDRYHAFAGWKANTAMGEADPFVTQIDSLGNYIFVASWKMVERYPVNVTVLDAKNNELSKDVAAIPFLYDSATGKKTKLEIVEMANPKTGQLDKFVYVLPGDQVFIEFVALNDDGTFMKTPSGDYRIVNIDEGIHFADVEANPNDYLVKYSYVSDTAEDTVKKIREERQYISIPYDVQDNGIIYVTARIALTSFNIQYWDLRGYDNSANPLTYTMFDEFEFVELLAGVNWVLVIPDEDVTNYDDVTTTPIKGVKMWSKGNLVLKADWPEEYDGTYKIDIELKDENGNVEITFPFASEEYKEKESIILNVVAKPGYQLKKNSLSYKKITSDVGQLTLSPLEHYGRGESVLPQVITPVDEKNGVYVFMMPASDVVVSAEFEPIEYTIFYNGVDGTVYNNNPDSYTVEDTIILNVPLRDGFEFVQWQDEYGNVVTSISGSVGHIELTPVWKVIEEETTTEEETTEKITTEDVTTKDDTSEDVTTNKEPVEDTTTASTESTTVPIGGNTPEKNTTTAEIVPPVQDETTSEKVTEQETTTKNQYIGGGDFVDDEGNIKTGDDTNTTRLVLILVCAATMLVLLVVLKKNKDDDDKLENEE